MAERRPRVLDLSHPGPRLEVVVRASPAAEMLIGLLRLGMDSAAETFDPRPPELEDDAEALSASTIGALDRLGGPGGQPWCNLLGLALRDLSEPTPAAFLSRLGDAPAVDVWLALAGGHAPVGEEGARERSTLLRAARGDARARAQLRRRHDAAERGLDVLADLGATEARAIALQGLGGWYREAFARRERPTSLALDRDAASKRELGSSLSPEELIERATGGLEYRREPGIRRVVLAPQIAMRPWNVAAGFDTDSIICYPIADESIGLDPTAPPPGLLRFHRALGDERRLRILRVLASRGTATLGELAEAVGLARSSAHHHLVILRAAGLVKLTTGEPGRYRLTPEPIPDAGRLLARFLGEGA